MYSASKLLAVVILGCAAASLAETPVLRVCADPNNLPFSNQAGQGFENRIADIFAKDLGMHVSYYWFPQRQAFFRKTLNARRCDVVMGVPTGISVAATTSPYYRSSYVFVSRQDRHLNIRSMDDPRLRQLKIGVHLTGDEDSNLPPVNALIRRGMTANLVGYDIYGKLSDKNPPADLIDAVARKKIDIAIAWGPMAGYFAEHSPIPLEVTPVDVVSPDPSTPFTFAISMGVRRGDQQLKQQLDAEIARRKPQIRRLLTAYGVPLLHAPSAVQVGY